MPIYVGNTKIDPSGIAKVYVGTQLVFQKQAQPEWHTIWSGTKTAKSENRTNSGTSNNFCSTAAGTGYTPQIRVTFSFSLTKPNYNVTRFWNNNSSSTTQPTSPLTINSLSSNNTNVVGVRITKYDTSSYTTITGTNTVYLTAHRDSTNNCVYFNIEANFTNTGTGAASGTKAQLTVTKIEQYY